MDVGRGRQKKQGIANSLIFLFLPPTPTPNPNSERVRGNQGLAIPCLFSTLSPKLVIICLVPILVPLQNKCRFELSAGAIC